MSRNALVLAALIGAIVLALLGHGHLADDVLDAVPPEPDSVAPVEPAPEPQPVEPAPVEAPAEPA
jgi:hypothetical protein